MAARGAPHQMSRGADAQLAAVAWRPTSTQAAARHRARIMRHERSARPRSAWPRRGATSIMHAMHAAAMHASQAAWSGSQRAAATWAAHGRGPAPTDARKHVARNRSSTEPSSQAQATLAVGKHVLELTQAGPRGAQHKHRSSTEAEMACMVRFAMT